MIRIIAVGRRHDTALHDAIKDYQKRLNAPYDTQWLLIPHSSQSDTQARVDESRRLLQKLSAEDFVILLDERGKLLDNTGLQRSLGAALDASRRVVCIIGGAYGVDDTVRARADMVWSLSPLVLPHQLVRLVLIEQVYRTQSMSHGHPYHHS